MAIWIELGCAVALVASLLLLWRSSGGRSLPGCAPGSSCDEVTASRWARIGQIPVALPAALVYAAMLVCALLNARTPLVALSTLATGAAAWFLIIQVFVLRRLCMYCTIAHVAAMVAAGFVLKSNIDPTAAAIGGIAVIVLIALQLLIRPKLYEIVTAPLVLAEPEPETAPTPPASQLPAPMLRAPRQIWVLQRQLSIDASLFPIIGPPDAPHILADIMDYTCKHCRELHPMLERAVKAFGGELAVLMIPVPLEPPCNRWVNIAVPEHVNACEYARLALAIWHAAPQQW